MTWPIFKQRIFGVSAKITGAAASIGGTYGFIKELINPTQTVWEIFSSPAAIVVYILIAITAICVLLNDKYKILSSENEILNQRIAELNMELNAASARLDSAMRNGQIATFKNKFFLATEKLYIDLAEKIHNNISISHMGIYNTIENTGIGDKKDSCIKFSILGVALNRISQIHILVAGDTIVKWEDIEFKAYELKNGEQVLLKARLADNGQDSYLKQVVISYDSVKKEGEIVNLMIYWKWPNMLNIRTEDYTTLPVILSTTTKEIEMSIESKLPIKFKEVGAYKYINGMSEAELIMDLKSDNNKIYYKDENPEYKSCFILYYKIADDR